MIQDQTRRNRRSIRLRSFDYSQPGSYFITVCTHHREYFFGNIVDEETVLSPIGQIVAGQWHSIPQRFRGVKLDEFIVMPNHIHGILHIVGAPLAGARDHGNIRATARVAPTSVGNIVGAYKSICAQHCFRWIKEHNPSRVLGKLWQRNYYEHIIRNDDELMNIREYIIHNPINWELDRENPMMVNAPQKKMTDKPWMV